MIGDHALDQLIRAIVVSEGRLHHGGRRRAGHHRGTGEAEQIEDPIVFEQAAEDIAERAVAIAPVADDAARLYRFDRRKYERLLKQGFELSI
jgi:hypothetical protein